eukprot:54666-Alexandrium_andersonii.AAC.1
MSASLVGSEMCIRDRVNTDHDINNDTTRQQQHQQQQQQQHEHKQANQPSRHTQQGKRTKSM